MYKISLCEIDSLFKAISAAEKLYLPVLNDGRSVFSEYKAGVRCDFSSVNTVRSAKDFFFPQVENIAEFKLSGKSIEIIENEDKNGEFVLFGVKACDARSFGLLDRVFLSEPCDPYYRSRRKNCTVISNVCTDPEESCFCTVFGVDPLEPEGDVVTMLCGDTLYWQPKTAKGDILTEKLGVVLTECDETEVSDCKNEIRNIFEKLPLKDLKLDYWTETDEKQIFNSSEWESVYNGCLGCGTCTFVCPTCQCYDVRDFNTGNGVKRFRCWDSCMYSDFTKMAHGNPRKTQKERFRQRFMHKLKYFPANNDGEFSCVGCGRCIRSCPQSLNIVKVIRSVKK